MGQFGRALVAAALLALTSAASACAAITPTVTEYSTGITLSSAPDGITSGPDGNLYFAEYNNRAIGIITTSGAVTEITIPTLGGNPPDPQDLVTDDGLVWFTDAGRDAIGSITPGSTHTIHEYNAGITPGALPHDITVGPDGNLWFSEAHSNLLGEMSPSDPTHTTHNYPSSALTGAQVFGLTTGPDHAVWFTERSANKIGRLNPGNPSAAPTTYSSGLTAASQPRSITSGPDGNLWFSESSVGKIARITTGGSIAEFPLPASATSPPPASRRPEGVVAGPDGAVWFVENDGGNTVSAGGSGAVGRITPSGQISEVPLTWDASRGDGDPGATGPFYLTVGPDGNIWFTEIEDARVGRITTPPGVFTGHASAVTYDSATVAGAVGDHAQTTSYHVDYGASAAYGASTANVSAGANIAPNFVAVPLQKLRPGAIYHYRVVATNRTGTTYGADAVFSTPKAKPKRLSLDVATGSPSHFKLSGKLSLPKGVMAFGACSGKVTIKIRRPGHKTTTDKVRLKPSCKYSAKLALHLTGSGKLHAKASFPGNRELLKRSSTTTVVRF